MINKTADRIWEVPPGSSAIEVLSCISNFLILCLAAYAQGNLIQYLLSHFCQTPLQLANPTQLQSVGEGVDFVFPREEGRKEGRITLT